MNTVDSRAIAEKLVLNTAHCFKPLASNETKISFGAVAFEMQLLSNGVEFTATSAAQRNQCYLLPPQPGTPTDVVGRGMQKTFAEHRKHCGTPIHNPPCSPTTTRRTPSGEWSALLP